VVSLCRRSDHDLGTTITVHVAGRADQPPLDASVEGALDAKALVAERRQVRGLGERATKDDVDGAADGLYVEPNLPRGVEE
jgi:hypothetical protein